MAVLSYRQAQAMARKRMVDRAHHAAGKRGPITVADAVGRTSGSRDNRKTAGTRPTVPMRSFCRPSAPSRCRRSRLRNCATGFPRWPTPPRLRSRKGEAPRHAKMDHSAEARRRRHSSANRVLTILKPALNFVWREGYVPSDTAWRRVEPFENVDAARLRYLYPRRSKAAAQRV